MADSFIETIRRSRRRVITGRLLGALSDLVVFGLLAVIAFGTWAESAGFGSSAWITFFVLLILVGLGHLLRELTRDTSLRAVAIRLDRELGFHDRVSSALAFSRHPAPRGFMRAHLEETAEFLQGSADRAIAVPWPGRIRAFFVFLVIGLVAMLPHADRTFIEQQDQRLRKEAHRESARDIVHQLGQLRQQASLHGLTHLSEMVAKAEKAFEQEVALLEPEDLKPDEETPPKSDGGLNSSDDKSGDAAKVTAGAVGSGKPGEGMRLSQVASYQPEGKFDSYPEQAYAEVFGELDDAIIKDDFFTATELNNMADHVSSIGGKISNFAYMDEDKAMVQELKQRSPRGREMMDDNNSFDRTIGALQHKAFSEFLKRYSAHLGEKALGQAHREQQALQKAKSGEVLNISAPPPKNAKFAMKGVSDQPMAPLVDGTAEQMAQLAAQTMVNGEASGQEMQKNAIKVRGGGTQNGGQGAGMGAAGRRGAAPKALPRAAGGEYLPLEGKLADGKSVIQVIDARGRKHLGAGRRSKVSYQEVFVEYAKGAEAQLNGEQVPLHMRDYIRDYFRSIRPTKAAAGKGAVQAGPRPDAEAGGADKRGGGKEDGAAAARPSSGGPL